DHYIDAFIELVEFAVCDEAGHFDQRVFLQIETCHLTVDPHQAVVHKRQLRTFPQCSDDGCDCPSALPYDRKARTGTRVTGLPGLADRRSRPSTGSLATTGRCRFR